MRVVTLDFETYFNSKEKYSLTNMGPLEYVRDPRFYVQCFSFRIDKGQTYVVPAVEGKDVAVLKALQLDRKDTITVGHNLNGFDCLVLSEHYGIRPNMLVDTIPMMHWLGLSRIMARSHKVLTSALGHGIKQAGTVVSDGKRTIEDFTPDEWKFFAQYCRDDTYQCSENFFSMLPYVKNGDALKLMSLTAKMATEPAFIPDGGLLEEYKWELNRQSVNALVRLQQFLHFNSVEDMLKGIRSRTTFPKLLEECGTACPMKWSEKQGKDIPAISKTDLEFTKLLQSDNEKVRLLVQTRLEHNSSIQMSRTQSLLTFADKPIPIMLSALNAHTGRYTAGNEGKSDGLNFQNLSKRDPSKLALRKALKVPAGYSVVACDSSQIEARILAWVSGQDDLVEQFRTGRDPYAEMASKIFHVPAQDIHDAAKSNADPRHNQYKTYRNVGKTCVLSAGYGVGAQKFSDTLLRTKVHLDPDPAKHEAMAVQAHAIYRQSSASIVGFWKLCDRVAQLLTTNTQLGEYGKFGAHNEFSYGRALVPLTQTNCAYIAMPNGYRIWYPNIRFVKEDGRNVMVYDRIVHGKVVPNHIYGGGVTENVCQSLAFMMLGWQACRMADAGIPLKANIHDAWIAVVPTAQAEQVKQLMEKIMSSTPEWLAGFPVGCEAEIGTDFTIA